MAIQHDAADPTRALSRRSFLKAGTAAGIAVKVSVLAPPAQARLMEAGPSTARPGPPPGAPATASTPSPR